MLRLGPTRDGESSFRHLLDSLPAAAYTCGPDGLITYFNRRAVDAWGREPKLNDPADRYCGSFRLSTPDGSRVPHDQCWMARCLHDQKEYDGEEVVVERPDGSRLLVEVHATPYFDENGGLIGAVNIVIDVTERRKSEGALRESEQRLNREANRRKDEFLATLAHELRNPLAPLRNAVEILRMEDTPQPEQREARDIIDRQVRQMTRLVDGLLDLSRITNGKINLQKEFVRLAAVVTDAVESSRPLIAASGHNLTVTLPFEQVYVEGDAVRLVQVFSNLLTNAAKYTEPGGRIWLTAECQDGEIVVSVRDTGIGMDAAQLPHVFEMFSQVAPASARSQGGLGIGLSLVRGLVELHGGSIEPRSGGIGRGSEFVVRLPIVETVTQEHLEPSTNARMPTLPPACRILVVDDNRDAAESLAMLLRLWGHDTHTADDGYEALQAAAKFRPHVVLLDIGLPNLGGYEVARRIRQQQWGRNMLLMALTGWGQDKDKRLSTMAGFDHHLTKPADPDVLTKLIALRFRRPCSG